MTPAKVQGAKTINSATGISFALVVGLVAFAAGGGLAWGTLGQRVSQVEKDVTALQTMQADINEIKTAVEVIKANLEAKP